ncbi:MAG: hypothetical protein L3I99_01985 [Sulfurimonas sp.]|nr:hypothetical protein [Sulfurimonas sp.]
MKDKNPTKNWKSFVAFFLFLFVYIYSVVNNSDSDFVWNTGLIALIAFLAMMSRSDVGAKLIDSLSAFLSAKGR